MSAEPDAQADRDPLGPLRLSSVLGGEYTDKTTMEE